MAAKGAVWTAQATEFNADVFQSWGFKKQYSNWWEKSYELFLSTENWRGPHAICQAENPA